MKELTAGKVIIDNRSIIDDAYQYDHFGNMVLSVELKDGEHISRASIDGNPIVAYYNQRVWLYISSIFV